MLRGRDFIVLHDPLCPGPCHVKPGLHLRKRKAYLLATLKGYVGPDADRSKAYLSAFVEEIVGRQEFIARLSAYQAKRPIVFWTTTSWQDQLTFWWVLDAIHHATISVAGLWVAELRLAQEYSDDEPTNSLGAFAPAGYREVFTARRPLQDEVVAAGADLWRQFAQRSPLEFDRTRRAGVSSFPELRRNGELYGSFFPQVSGRKHVKLALCSLDRMLFEALREDRWLRPVDLIRRLPWQHLQEWLSYGDMFLLRRLREWARHNQPKPALLVKEEPNGTSAYNAVSYRLTWHGARLRDEGLQSPKEAPPMWVGGCRVYSAEETWVRRAYGADWWIEELQR